MRRLISAILVLGAACSSTADTASPAPTTADTPVATAAVETPAPDAAPTTAPEPAVVSTPTPADTAVSWADAVDVDGTWELISGTVDGEAIRPFLGMTVSPDGILAESNCNDFTLTRDGGPGLEKLKRCFHSGDAVDPMVVQEGFIELVRAGPRFENELMVFRGERGELVYERLPDYEPAGVFSVLADPEQLVDASAIRGVRGDPAALLEHHATDASVYLSVSRGLLCTTWALEEPKGSSCTELRRFLRGAGTWDLTTGTGPIGVRFIVIPDAFVDAAADALAGLADGAGNLFLVSPSAPDQTITFTNAAGDTYTVTIGLG